MLHVIIFFILSILLAALCAVSIYRNFLSQYKMSSNGFMTILILFLVIAALLYSLGSILGTTFLQENIIKLNSSPDISPDELEALRQSIKLAPGYIIRYLGIGYVFFAAHIAIIKIIQWKLNGRIKKYADKRWKL
jgi:hypothetical protein